MAVRSLNICSEGDGEQRLVITDEDGGYFVFTLDAGQTMLLAQQAMTQIWNYYNLVPRD